MHSSLGSDMSARPMASICCSPPERVPEIWFGARLQDRKHGVNLFQIFLAFLLVLLQIGPGQQVFQNASFPGKAFAVPGKGSVPVRTISWAGT